MKELELEVIHLMGRCIVHGIDWNVRAMGEKGLREKTYDQREEERQFFP